MSEEICKYKDPHEHTPVVVQEDKKTKKMPFGNFKIWFVVLVVYVTLFGYIGYIAFWPMAFNNPEQTVDRYLIIVDKYANKIGDETSQNLFRTTIHELIKESEAEADDMQQLASQSFNIVLGAFLAFLSATVTTIFQGNRG